MQINLEHAGKKYHTDLAKGIDLSSTYGLPEAEPRAWYADPVKTEPVKMGEWIGEVRKGSAVNFFNIFLNPHGNGTHTECVGHISPERQSVNAFLPPFHCVAQYVKLLPENKGGEKVVTLASLLEKAVDLNCEALLVEVPMPFPQDFSGSQPPFFEPALMQYLRENGIRHFLTNLPSVDPEEDGGALAAHKAFWDYPKNPDLSRTITELVHFKEELQSQKYLLNLQVAPLHNDAAPSRPVLYPLELF